MTDSGAYLKQFQFALLEEGLKHGPFDDADFEAGGERLPLVVDISKFHPDKTKPTGRSELHTLITELEDANAKAIGVDLEFSESDSDSLVGEDYQYLAKWQRYGNVRVGIYRRAVKPRDAWLGRPEFADLAAGIALPKEDPQRAFLYTRTLYGNCGSGDSPRKCQEDLIGMPVALWILSERKETGRENALKELEARAIKYSYETWLQSASFMIDYSYLKEIRKESSLLTMPSISVRLALV